MGRNPINIAEIQDENVADHARGFLKEAFKQFNALNELG